MNKTDSKQPEPSNEAEREAGFAAAHGSAVACECCGRMLAPVRDEQNNRWLVWCDSLQCHEYNLGVEVTPPNDES